MRRIFSVLLSLIVLSVHAQTADEVIAKYAASIGGADAFAKIKTLKVTGSVTTQGMDLPITVQVINNQAVRSDVEVPTMNTSIIRAYKDGKGWQQNPFTGAQAPTPVTGPELNDLKEQSMLVPSLIDYKHRGSTVELSGQEDVNGTKAFKITLTNKDQPAPITFFISTADYSLLKANTTREIQGAHKNIETLFSDLKDVNGTKMSMTLVQKLDGQQFQTIKFTKVDVDQPIDEKIFDMPSDKAK